MCCREQILHLIFHGWALLIYSWRLEDQLVVYISCWMLERQRCKPVWWAGSDASSYGVFAACMWFLGTPLIHCAADKLSLLWCLAVVWLWYLHTWTYWHTRKTLIRVGLCSIMWMYLNCQGFNRVLWGTQSYRLKWMRKCQPQVCLLWQQVCQNLNTAEWNQQRQPVISKRHPQYSDQFRKII